MTLVSPLAISSCNEITSYHEIRNCLVANLIITAYMTSILYCRYKLLMKLFFVMVFHYSINWSVEVITWLNFKFISKYMWYIADLTNALHGLIIFITFVWNDRVKKLLLKRFSCQKFTCCLFYRNSQRAVFRGITLCTYTITTKVTSLCENINICRRIYTSVMRRIRLTRSDVFSTTEGTIFYSTDSQLVTVN